MSVTRTAFYMVLTGLMLTPVTGLMAKIKPQEYTTENQTFSTGGLANERFGTRSPSMDTRFNNQIVQFGEWHGSYSSLGQSRAAISTGDRFTTKNYRDVSILEYDRRLPTMAPQNRQSASMRGHDRFRYQGRQAQIDPMDRSPLQQLLQQQGIEGKDLSMQDINRYQFRRSRSTEAGLPVQSPAMRKHEEANRSFWDLFSDDDAMESAGQRLLLPSNHPSHSRSEGFSRPEPQPKRSQATSQSDQRSSQPAPAMRTQRGDPLPAGQSRLLQPGEGGAPEVMFSRPEISVSVE